MTHLADRYTGFALKVRQFGKPTGLWYAPGYEWVKRMDRLQSWDIVQQEGAFVIDMPFPKIREFYTGVLENTQIPDGTGPGIPVTRAKRPGEAYDPPAPRPHYVYSLPLTDASFELDMTNPDPTKIFKLTADTILLFETAFQSFYSERVPGSAERADVATRLRTYGDFLADVMEPAWGGIDYDQSLFTDPLKEAYPFLPYVEIASGCLWKPNQVLAGYTPTPTAVLAITDTVEKAKRIESSITASYDRAAYETAKKVVNAEPEFRLARREAAYRGEYWDDIEPPRPEHPTPPIVDRLFIAGVNPEDGTLFLFKRGNVVKGGRRKQRRTRKARKTKRRVLTRSRYVYKQ